MAAMDGDSAAEKVPGAPPETAWQWPVVALANLLVWTLGRLPAWLAYGIGDLLAVPWYIYWRCRDPRGRSGQGFWRNRRIVYRTGAPLGATPPRHLLWRWSRAMAALAIDFCRMHHIRADNLAQHCDTSEFPALQQLFASGRGLICATGHIGVWDVAGHAAGLLGLPITSVFRPSPLPGLNRMIERLRTTTGQTVVARKNVLWTLKKVLARREAVGILCDGSGKRGAVVAPFLGTAARTVATPALLHLASGAPIAVVAVLRIGRQRYRLRVYDIIDVVPGTDRDADVLAITRRINDGLSHAIAEAPEQWFWQSRRFRHRPTDEAPGADGLPPLWQPPRAKPHTDQKFAGPQT